MSTQSVRAALSCDKSAVKTLLCSGFGNEEGFLRAFFSHIWQKCEILLSTENGEIAAMTALLPCTLQPARQPLYYLYALTTLPAYRRRGHAKALLCAAQKYGRSVFLHAANQELYAFYERQGWTGCMFARWQSVAAPAQPSLPLPLSADEYFARREMLLRPVPHIQWDGALPAFAGNLLSLDGGGFYGMDDAVFALQRQDGNALQICEMIGAQASGAASALAQARGCRLIRALCACAPDEPDAFALTQQQPDAALPAFLHCGFTFE